MMILEIVLVLLPVCFFVYAYAVYPAALWMISRGVRPRASTNDFEWPTVTLTLPVYNEELNLRRKLDDLLQLDYPKGKLQILVISDASTDSTDDIAASYATRGVELLRLPVRRGKTAAENAAASASRGSIIVNSDATVRVPPRALKALVSAFADQTVGVASGRDVSVGASDERANRAESQYVGYEMWLRGLETRIGSIVGASGCFYGIRSRIYDSSFPEELSRDFASALMARANGLRAVSVDDAICYVPRAGALRAEFRRKIRTMARGLETLWYWRRMMNPFRHGAFSLMLVSHKLCRWLVYLFLPLALVGLAMLASSSRIGIVLATTTLAGLLAGALAWYRAQRAEQVNRIIALAGFALASVLAGVLAWVKVLRRQRNPIWEPTRRTVSGQT
ncbi:MAG TPA: glycosyltransferase [Gemmatimonadaceae bacterium]|nr:glycosyltransferase [Gemmatimonadaceae bacterium]